MFPKVGANSTPVKEENPSWLSVYDSLTSSSAHASTTSTLESDGSFRFFWLDHLEHEGVLYFIGKTLDRGTNAYVSCCVTVENLQRNLFVLPRPFH
jgi:DNA polymerase alpha subunit A